MAPKRSSANDASSLAPKRLRVVQVSSDFDSSSESGSSSSSSSSGFSNDTEIFARTGLPSSWFINPTAAKKWVKEYDDRLQCMFEEVHYELFTCSSLPGLEALQASSIWIMLNPGESSYPRLTRMFNANLSVRRERGEWILNTVIKGKKITLTLEIIVDIFGIPLYDASEDSNPARTLRLAKEQLLLPSDLSPPTITCLTLEARIVYSIIDRCIVPRVGNKEILTNSVLMLTYNALNGLKVNLPEIILSHMVNVINSPSTNHLPYGNLLPIIFTHFSIDYSGEVLNLYNDGLDETFIETIGIKKTKVGFSTVWVLMDQPEWNITTQQRLNFVEDSFKSLTCDFIEFRASMTDQMDKAQDLLGILNQKINQLFHVSAMTLTAASSIKLLSEEDGKETHQDAEKVMDQCHKVVKDKPIRQPMPKDPGILTIEEFGVVKKYAKDSTQRGTDLSLKERDLTDAKDRWRDMCLRDYYEKGSFSKWYKED